VSEGSVGDVVEDTAERTGLWFEGIVTGTLIALPIFIMMGLVMGLAMGATRFSARKMETVFKVGGNQ
jgi:hypothetical protein